MSQYSYRVKKWIKNLQAIKATQAFIEEAKPEENLLKAIEIKLGASVLKQVTKYISKKQHGPSKGEILGILEGMMEDEDEVLYMGYSSTLEDLVTEGFKDEDLRSNIDALIIEQRRKGIETKKAKRVWEGLLYLRDTDAYHKFKYSSSANTAHGQP